MNFVKHSNLEGQHAFLGASTYHWINYTEEKVADAYAKYRAAQRGTVLHSFAAQCIKLGQRLPKSQKTLNMYVNDAIGYRDEARYFLCRRQNQRERVSGTARDAEPQSLSFPNLPALKEVG